MTLGLGAALTAGTGVAYAEGGTGSPSSQSSSSAESDGGQGAPSAGPNTGGGADAGADADESAGNSAGTDDDEAEDEDAEDDSALGGPDGDTEDDTDVEDDADDDDAGGGLLQPGLTAAQGGGSTTTKKHAVLSTTEAATATVIADGSALVEEGYSGDVGAEPTAAPEVTGVQAPTTFKSAALSTSSSNVSTAADEPAPAAIPKAIAVPVLKFVGGFLNLFGVNTNSPLPPLDLGLAAAWTWFRQLQTEWGVAPPSNVVATSGEPDPETGKVTGVLTANNPSGLALTYKVTIDPLLGEVTVGADGAFTYTPSEAARLAAILAPISDVFTVTVSNGIASSYSLVTVPIGATTAGTPSIPSTVSQSTNTTTGLVTGQVGSTGPAGHPITYQVLTQPLFGTLNFDSATGQYTYQPSAVAMALASLGLGALGDAFTVVAKNGSLTSLPGIISVPITAGNATPTAPVSLSQNVNALTGQVTGQVGSTDPGGQSLTYTVITSTLGGTLTLNSQTGQYTYQPSALAMALAAAGLGNVSDVFTVVATNGILPSTPSIITVPITAIEGKPGTPVGGAQTTNAVTGVVTGSVSATDPIGAGVTYDVITSTLGGTLNFNEQTGTYTYTPSAAARTLASTGISTPDVFTVVAVNAAGTSSIATITVPIAPNPAAPSTPVKTNQQITTSNGRVTGKLVATDPNGLTLTYTLTLAGIQGSYTVSSNGDFTFTPSSAARYASWLAGGNLSDVFTVTVSNGYSSTSAIITVPVSPKGPF
ncbi:Ig-like domain-containing protein [Mycolicibacterium bacteremicum]|uniref:Ig-like domain-containing protein n=1 Tax=Mycolicibacterium bacteremicum TaxID=564198 RepID=UPI0026EDA408|nr:Ig-like domain-containing protein [Mycolicibacterium bacteremicum]